MVRDKAVPVMPSGSDRVLLVGDYPEFLSEGRLKYNDAGVFTAGTHPIGERKLADLMNRAEEYDTVIVCLSDEETLQTLSRLHPLADKIVVLSVLNPVFLAETPWVQTAVAVYGTGIDSFKAGFAALAGDFIPEGRLPFLLPGDP